MKHIPLFLLIAATSASAADGLLPPPSYDHQPTNMWLKERVTSREEVIRLCRQELNIDESLQVLGCSTRYWLGNNEYGCVVIRIDVDQIRRHEYGHCNGWHHGPEFVRKETATGVVWSLP